MTLKELCRRSEYQRVFPRIQGWFFRYCVGETPVKRLKEDEKCSIEEKPVRSPISVTLKPVFSRNCAAAAIRASFSFWENVLPKYRCSRRWVWRTLRWRIAASSSSVRVR